ncbi:MAG: HD domain-containing protein [Bacteroidota bacterium]
MTPRDLATWSGRCEAFVRQRMTGDAGHDLAHIRRVVVWARQLAEADGADLTVVVPAAWLHDLVTVPKSSPDRARASKLSADAASGWLRESGYPGHRIPAIAHAIEAHSFSAGVEPRTLEAEVVQDADRLDALGAIGVARCYATAGAMGSALVHPDDPVPSDSPGRPLDDRRFATDHFQVKLLRLPATMRTAAGRAEAKRRVRFMRDFLRQLAQETGEEP